MSYPRIAEDLEQILDRAGRLIEGRWPFPTAMADHVARMLAIRGGRTELLWSVDAVRARYLPATTSTATIRSGRAGPAERVCARLGALAERHPA
jgi:hypothetical protein